jgi:hypothetical protein
MAASKTFFEQIPIETVKRIAMEFPAENVTERDGGNTEMSDEVSSPRESWREVAQQVLDEPDPKRVVELAEQLIATLDREKLCKHLPRKPDAGNRSE